MRSFGVSIFINTKQSPSNDEDKFSIICFAMVLGLY